MPLERADAQGTNICMESGGLRVDAVILTGASSGIGLCVSRMLCRLGYEVSGFGREFASVKPDKEDVFLELFHPVVCDLLDTDRLLAKVKEITNKSRVVMLVNNAGTAYFGPHEELNPQKIQQMTRVNLEVPMILTQQLLRTLKKHKGYVINIASVTAYGTNPHGCAYGATKAGLAGFSHSLFDEVRKYGVKVVTVFPDMTQTNLYRNADFKESEEELARILPEEVAQAVEFAISQREGLVVSDLTLKPQLHRIHRKPVK